MEELWTEIPGYEGKYIISTEGRIISVNYNNTGKPRELKYKINHAGYKEVKLSKNNKTKNFLVSTLVGKTFLPNKNFKDNVMIKSADKLDISVNNLKWAYYSERQHNAYNKGARKIGKTSKTRITFNGKNYKSYEEIRRKYKIDKNTFWQRFYVRGWSLQEAIEIPVGRR
jgi:hypothetical protein